MKKLSKRALSGLVFVSVLIFAILFSKISFISLFFVLMIFCLYEFQKMIKLKSVFPYLIGTQLFIFGNILNVEDLPSITIYEYVGVLLFLTIFISFASILLAKKEDVISHLGKIFLTIIYIVVPFTLMVQIPFLNTDYNYVNTTILGVFILIWTSDTFAFLIGKNFGKHKLLERISPNKTIEGFIGGMVFTFIASFVLAKFFTTLSLDRWVVIAGIVSIFGVLGDLIESMFKRQAGVKDSSNFIPGHGGFLDRFDSVIFAAPFIFIYLQVAQ
ncbi:phosphatidate cytidylyltransferase [Lutibacter sp. HS1-25]|uniref:phosphatidate cytidylyltransferase n=1 Tax=Lutibacter sp. HS1-25 TaxID=2485000 RepID=UPI001011F66D|nr:phosphatidate cytidylyltransferase [Lutibacter sp. HS1-25]RXP46596.1 phosphatidate cytidylyltransferase [Lutibacter sp. HS1-25]